MSAFTCGTAAGHILAGDITSATIGAAIAACAWCQVWRYNRGCWHSDAQILLAAGLRAAPGHDRRELGPAHLPFPDWEITST